MSKAKARKDGAEMFLLADHPEVKPEILVRRFDTPDQTASDARHIYDVRKAWRIVNRWSRSKRKRRLLSLLVSRCVVPHQRPPAGRVDLAIPVLAARNGKEIVLIDGRHRQQKAVRTRVRILPLFLLTRAESQRITSRLRATKPARGAEGEG